MINSQCEFWKNLEYYEGFRLEESLLRAYFELFLELLCCKKRQKIQTKKLVWGIGDI